MACANSNSSRAEVTDSVCFCQLGMMLSLRGEGRSRALPFLTHTYTLSFRGLSCLQFHSMWFVWSLPPTAVGTGMHPLLGHMGTYSSFANESQAQDFELRLSGSQRILSTKFMTLVDESWGHCRERWA